MLSRIAESLFWIGRYVERADDTARLLDIHLQILLEDPWAEEDLACRSLLAVMDQPLPGPDESVGRSQVLDALTYDRSSPSSIVGALTAARENARRAREVISTELWEALNGTWNQLPHQVRQRHPHALFDWVRERAALVTGLTASVVARDDTWQFMILGRSIERADMTARLLTTRALVGATGPDWTTLLRSCGAYETYVRRQRGIASDDSAAAFLLTDRSFPRSVVHALGQAEVCLEALRPAVDQPAEDDARMYLGQARTGLLYRPRAEVVRDLPRQMATVQRACAAATDAIRAEYFPSGVTTTWTGGVL